MNKTKYLQMWTFTLSCENYTVSLITRQDIRDILVSFDSGLIYRHVSESFETRREQVENVEDETNVPCTISFSSCFVLSRRECKPGINNQMPDIMSRSPQGKISRQTNCPVESIVTNKKVVV